MWDWLHRAFDFLFDGLVSLFTGLWRGLVAAFSWIGQVVVAGLTWLVQWVNGLVGTLAVLIAGVVSGVFVALNVPQFITRTVVSFSEWFPSGGWVCHILVDWLRMDLAVELFLAYEAANVMFRAARLVFMPIKLAKDLL